MNTLNKQLLPLLLLLTLNSCLVASPNIQLPDALVPLNERVERDVKTRLQSEAEQGDLYNIDEYLRQTAFKYASIIKKKELALNYFKNHKNNLIRQVVFSYLAWEVAKLTFSIVLGVACWIGLGMYKEYIKSRAGTFLSDASLEAFINIYVTLIFGSVIGMLVGWGLKVGSNTITLLRFYYDPAELYQKTAPLEARYMSIKWYISSEHKDYVERIEDWLVSLRTNSKRQDQTKLVEELLSLVDIDRRADGCLLWDEKRADEVLIAFKPAIRKQLKGLAFSIMLRLNLFKLRGARDSFTSIFYGIPGTGKTYAAYCIAKILNTPSFQIDLGVSNESLFGSQNQRSGNLTQAIGYALRKKHGDCAVCICDDGDRALNSQKIASSWQLDLLDTTKDRYRDAFFNVDVCKPIVIMFTGNYGDEIDPAASNRFVSVIHFKDPFTKEGILMILDNYMNSLIESYQGLPYSVTREDFSKREWKSFKEQAIREAELAGDKGLRTAKYYVQEYFIKKVKKKHDAMLGQLTSSPCL